MAINDDFSIAVNGDIRHVSGSTNYTVLEFHRYLQDYADNASVVSNELIDITSSTPSDRSTDNIITLLAPYNIDDVAAKYLYDGSITQDSGDTIYGGLVVVGSVSGTTKIQVSQDEQVLPSFWDTGINPDTGAAILSRMLIKIRKNAADIDGRRIRVWCRELGDSYAEFQVTMALGNNVAALFTGSDLNNQSTESTIASWTTVTNISEGYVLLDIASDGSADEPYYAEWDQGSQTKAQLYERTKWLSMGVPVEDSATETGTDYPFGDGTTTGQGQSFATLTHGVSKALQSAKFFLKKTGAPTGNIRAALYSHNGSFGTSSVPNALLATSKEFDASKLLTTYEEIEFPFVYADVYSMAATTNYVVILEEGTSYSGGASDYVQVRGAAAGSAAGNKSANAGGWTAQAAADLSFQVISSPILYSLPGQRFRGITHQFDYDTQTTNFTETNIIAWGTSFAYDGGTGTVPAVGQYWENTTTGGKGKIVWVSPGAGATGSVVVQRESSTPTWVDPGTLSLLGGTGSIAINGTVTAPVSSSTGGSAVILADDDNGASGTLWVQLVSGTIAGNNDPLWQRGSSATDHGLVNGSATTRTVSASFLGSFTGAAIIGAFGIGIEPADGVAADTLTALDTSVVNPPNNQKFTVFGLNTVDGGGDRVMVCTSTGSTAPDLDQFTTTADLTINGETTVDVSPAIPSDTPASGTLRVELDDGTYRYVVYDSWTGSAFTLNSSYQDWSTLQATTGNNVFITYIDKQAAVAGEEVTLKYSSPRTMFVRVRNGNATTPIKTFQSDATFGSGGGSTTAIRLADY